MCGIADLTSRSPQKLAAPGSHACWSNFRATAARWIWFVPSEILPA